MMNERMKKQLDDLIKLTIKPAIWEDILEDGPWDDDGSNLYLMCANYIKENL